METFENSKNHFHEEIVLRDLRLSEKIINEQHEKLLELRRKNKKYIKKYVIPLIICFSIFSLAGLKIISIIEQSKELVGISRVIDVKPSFFHWLMNIRRLSYIMIAICPFFLYYSLVCFGIYAYIPGSIIPEKVAIFLGQRNYWKEKRTIEKKIEEEYKRYCTLQNIP